jgi:hypothetical protein
MSFFKEIIGERFTPDHARFQLEEMAGIESEMERVMVVDEETQSTSSAKGGKDLRSKSKPSKATSQADEPEEKATPLATIPEERAYQSLIEERREERKLAHEKAKIVMKALAAYENDCISAAKTVLNTQVISKGILQELDSMMGEHEESLHFIGGYGAHKNGSNIVE